MELAKAVARSRFTDEEELIDYLVENRRTSLQKLANATGLAVFELRRLLSSREFRKATTERLSLEVVTLETEQRLLESIADGALDPETKLVDRVRAAEFLLRHSGLERARETKVDVDHGVRVSFDPVPSLPGGWVPPDPLAGVVGTPALPAHTPRRRHGGDLVVEALAALPDEEEEALGEDEEA